MVSLYEIKNTTVQIRTTDPTVVYEVSQDKVGQVSAIVISCQIANITDEDIPCTAYVQGEDGTLYSLCTDFILPPNNSYDPLVGNLVISGSTKLVIQGSEAGLDVVVSLVEIANAITG